MYFTLRQNAEEIRVKRISILVMLGFSLVCAAQTARIKSGSTVYIEPDGGYETYLSAAIIKKHVPVIVVVNKEKAQYVIQSTVSQSQPNQSAIVVNNNIGGRYSPGADPTFPSTSIAVVDANSSEVVFAYSAGPAVRGRTADRCADHLKKFIEKK
jgi:hypothetical protein